MRWCLVLVAACSSRAPHTEPIVATPAVDAAIAAPADAVPPRDAVVTTLLPPDAAPTVIVTVSDECGLVIDTIFFREGSAEIQAPSKPIIESLAAQFECWIRTGEFSKFEVGGHADDKEKDAQRLSEERAVNVANAFTARGVPATAMSIVGYGNMQPRDKKKTKSARAKNRRVEFLILERPKRD